MRGVYVISMLALHAMLKHHSLVAWELHEPNQVMQLEQGMEHGLAYSNSRQLLIL